MPYTKLKRTNVPARVALKPAKVKTSSPLKKLKRAALTFFRPSVFSRHPSHAPLRKLLKLLPFRAVIRFGSTTNSKHKVQCNSVESIKNSADKLLMKRCFNLANVRTAAAWTMGLVNDVVQFIAINTGLENYHQSTIPYPIIIKHRRGSRGKGIYLLNNLQDLLSWLHGKTLTNYIVEKYHKYTREYRLHVTKNGCFYTCRKMIKSDTPDNQRWYRNDSNCTWIVESNELFDKPINWVDIESDCVKALNAVGLDIGACDVKVQSAFKKNGNLRTSPEYIVLEINSAPSLKEQGLVHYQTQLPKILRSKFIDE